MVRRLERAHATARGDQNGERRAPDAGRGREGTEQHIVEPRAGSPPTSTNGKPGRSAKDATEAEESG
jgi:hypothetical protein